MALPILRKYGFGRSMDAVKKRFLHRCHMYRETVATHRRFFYLCFSVLLFSVVGLLTPARYRFGINQCAYYWTDLGMVHDLHGEKSLKDPSRESLARETRERDGSFLIKHVCVCERETICADTFDYQIIFLAFARFSAYFAYPIYGALFLTKCRYIHRFLATRFLGQVTFPELTRDPHELHSLLGRYVVFDNVWHSFWHILRWYLDSTKTNLNSFEGKSSMELLYTHQTGLTGLLMLFSLCLIVFPHIYQPLRRKLTFERRYSLHFFFWVYGLALTFHAPSGFSFYVMGTTLVIYTVDSAVCLIFHTHTIETIYATIISPQVLKLSFRAPENSKHFEGYCYLNIPALSKSQWHAFSIVRGFRPFDSVDQSSEIDERSQMVVHHYGGSVETQWLSLFISVAGDWTEDLLSLVTSRLKVERKRAFTESLEDVSSSPSESSSESSSVGTEVWVPGTVSDKKAEAEQKRLHLPFTTLSAYLYGPVKATNASLMYDAKYILAFAGGIGITPCLDLIQRESDSVTKAVCLVWMVRDLFLLEWMLGNLDWPEDAWVFVFFTNAQKMPLLVNNKKIESGLRKNQKVVLARGRPDLKTLPLQIMSNMQSDHPFPISLVKESEQVMSEVMGDDTENQGGAKKVGRAQIHAVLLKIIKKVVMDNWWRLQEDSDQNRSLFERMRTFHVKRVYSKDQILNQNLLADKACLTSLEKQLPKNCDEVAEKKVESPVESHQKGIASQTPRKEDEQPLTEVASGPASSIRRPKNRQRLASYVLSEALEEDENARAAALGASSSSRSVEESEEVSSISIRSFLRFWVSQEAYEDDEVIQLAQVVNYLERTVGEVKSRSATRSRSHSLTHRSRSAAGDQNFGTTCANRMLVSKTRGGAQKEEWKLSELSFSLAESLVAECMEILYPGFLEKLQRKLEKIETEDENAANIDTRVERGGVVENRSIEKDVVTATDATSPTKLSRLRDSVRLELDELGFVDMSPEAESVVELGDRSATNEVVDKLDFPNAPPLLRGRSAVRSQTAGYDKRHRERTGESVITRGSENRAVCKLWDSEGLGLATIELFASHVAMRERGTTSDRSKRRLSMTIDGHDLGNMVGSGSIQAQKSHLLKSATTSGEDGDSAPLYTADRWKWLYCGQSKSVIESLKETSNSLSVGLHVESFNW